jgi:hypothetical protein
MKPKKQSHSKELYTPAEVKVVREQLLLEQNGKDKLTGLQLNPKDSVTDHNHKTHFVRGILHRQSNAVLGKIENMWTRYLKYWYNGTLSDFLRKAADYLELPDDKRFVHPGWLKAMVTKFRALTEKEKADVLSGMGKTDKKNSALRIQEFKTALNSRQFTLTQMEHLFQKVKDNK